MPGVEAALSGSFRGTMSFMSRCDLAKLPNCRFGRAAPRRYAAAFSEFILDLSEIAGVAAELAFQRSAGSSSNLQDYKN